MTTNKNALSDAIIQNEIDKFLIGEGPYFVSAKTDNEEPQNVDKAFDSFVYEYWKATKDPEFQDKLITGLLNLLNNHPDQNKAVYVVVDWIWAYFYRMNKRQTNPNDPYKDLFHLNLDPVLGKVRSILETRRAQLIIDTRWAGASWNSSNGLWDPLVRTLQAIKNKLNGPDFLPHNS